ncbi:cellulose synthase/poly-beta-1,6-N-acetylglucosamine synthase-like glycosyltransferase [Stakelama pacifica]|uniref:Chitooligosaccharide deacetylase n=2 Tax=Stakelama pacifica TaxID=517720 RepID=A0A4R6FNT3_9SPHN|nr:cellulose synthase/poly-beta-1,6-N-acetylglucosamine synthase-like glycosyltransferase [Stakelama pacifica]GGO95602.1 glycosyl transferase family 2 [Stakelama pacifica]
MPSVLMDFARPMSKPVFFDASGKRRRWSGRFFLLGWIVIAVGIAIFALTLVDLPTHGDLPLNFEMPRAAPLRTQIAAIGHRLRSDARRATAWLPHRHSAAKGAPVTLGFYVPWDETSATSLREHIGSLDWVAPALMQVTRPDHALERIDDPRFDRILHAALSRPKVLPVVQNVAKDQWETVQTARLLADPKASDTLAHAIADSVMSHGDAGIVFDFESLQPRQIPQYRALIEKVHRLFRKKGLIVAVTLPAEDAAWSPAAFARISDRLILMDYDYHWQGGQSGPIAPQPWFINVLRNTLRSVPPEKVIVAIGNYAYDWHGNVADALSVEEAWQTAGESGAKISFDPQSGNAAFGYDENGEHHDVWMLDAVSAWNELRASEALGAGGVALWRLGGEDPGFWPALRDYRTSSLPDLTTITQTSNVSVEGTGEILRITATPRPGTRQVMFDPAHIAVGERYITLPTPYVVRRTGARDHEVALTFDDGPDGDWTPKILSILEHYHVPGTFFVIGENALEHPQLLRRIVADGDEIGNHTYTHPNLANVGPRASMFELNATQRLIEAYTGRSTRLFRAPYFGDAEPTTADEIGPALQAQQRGYTEIGLHADPDDWKRPGADAIVARTIAAVESATPDKSENIILLHDGGGDRSQTVAALPRIITTLEARGYRFVPVSSLAGLTREAAMPPVGGDDLLAVRADVALFAIMAGLTWLLKWMFFIAITLGIARAVAMAVLALIERRRRGAPPEPYTPSVSVVIPAFNEAQVIEASVRRVLGSDYPGLSVIVADDGSSDGTSEIVARAFGDDDRVTLLTLENGGKARALNRALAISGGEIVIALDADTQFEPETIARLARWFADPAIGAVAGNAKVGNRVNLVTRWQAVEYVTAQNLERRALAGFDAITVVPGAVGAWRRAAIEAAGGYPEDTLAEDQDLTIAIQRLGWRVDYDPDAIAWTEAPHNFRSLAKQRYRWAFGTLQCLWKHRAVIRTRKPAGLALIGMPQAWLFQIGFAAISPLIDLALLLSIAGTALRVHQHGWAQTQTDVLRIGIYWAAFITVDLVCGWTAYRLDGRERRFPALLLIAQRFVYRQIMYWVVLRALRSALAGWGVGWGKLERKGTVSAPAGPADSTMTDC